MLANMVSAKTADDSGRGKEFPTYRRRARATKRIAATALHRSMSLPGDDHGLLRQDFNGCACNTERGFDRESMRSPRPVDPGTAVNPSRSLPQILGGMLHPGNALSSPAVALSASSCQPGGRPEAPITAIASCGSRYCPHIAARGPQCGSPSPVDLRPVRSRHPPVMSTRPSNAGRQTCVSGCWRRWWRTTGKS